MDDKDEVKKRAMNIRKIRLEREKAVFMKLGGKLRAYFFTGILVTAPVMITFLSLIRLSFLSTFRSTACCHRSLSRTTSCRLPFPAWELSFWLRR